MQKKPLKVLSKNRFLIVNCFIALFLLIDTLFGLRVIVKLQTVWYESTVGFIFVFLLSVLTVGFFNSFISRIYLYSEYIYIRTLFKRRKIYYRDLAELHFYSSASLRNFTLCGAGEKQLANISIQYLGKLEKQKDFIRLLMNQQPTIRLDQNCERLLER
jgi:hypothetical protein